MRFMVMVKATKDSEAGVIPKESPSAQMAESIERFRELAS